ncbi:hypothetical protein ElyMa_001888700 [Elysia marginata]|uniref:Uncharacterized protein n=1 Tax=Elysia marginata TaxID=1093978 RepID=A0AAV4ER43_9GAST|nr:hypothetical protein ElyMa_001888700 [Elysia marginata]
MPADRQLTWPEEDHPSLALSAGSSPCQSVCRSVGVCVWTRIQGSTNSLATTTSCWLAVSLTVSDCVWKILTLTDSIRWSLSPWPRVDLVLSIVHCQTERVGFLEMYSENLGMFPSPTRL